MSSLTFADDEHVTATPLQIAAAYGEVDIARYLIEHGASVDGMDGNSRTPLHFAAEEGQTQVIDLLISSGANVNARDSSLFTPSMKAAVKGEMAAVQALIKGGADLKLQDDMGFTALHHAIFHAASDALWIDPAFSENLGVIILLTHKTKGMDLYADTKSGFSIFMCSYWAYPPYQSFLLNLAPNPSVYEPRLNNIVTATVGTKNPIDLKRLLRRLPRSLIPTLLAHRAQMSGTPLYAAATFPSEKVIDMLLDAGADLDLVGGDDGTPLMGACAAGRLEVVKILVRKGARTSYTAEEGKVVNVLDAARLHPKITRWLLVGRFAEGPLSIEDGSI